MKQVEDGHTKVDEMIFCWTSLLYKQSTFTPMSIIIAAKAGDVWIHRYSHVFIGLLTEFAERDVAHFQITT